MRRFIFDNWHLGGGNYTPLEQEARRSALDPKSAEFVLLGAECIGIRSGNVTFPFRTPVAVEVAAEAPAFTPAPVTMHLDVYICCDFLAAATLIGHPGQAGCSCIWCRANAAGYKRIAANRSYPHELRTPESEAADLEACQAQADRSGNINGVSKAPLFPVTDFMKILPPVLHIFLGLVNFVIQRINQVCPLF